MDPNPPQPQQPPYSELASFGEELRREREIRGISLKEISDATKISKRFLEAIERNDHRTLPAPVFTRGFVREYARYLGLNAEEMVNRYNYAAAGDDRIERTAHLDRLVQPREALPTPQRGPHAPRHEPKRAIPPPYARIDRNVYLLVIIVAALIGVSWWAVNRKRERAVAAAAGEEPARIADTSAVAQPRPAPAAAQPAAPPQDDSTLRLVIDASEDSWIDLDVDGQPAFDEVVHKGEQRAFEAKERFYFRVIGNAGGVRLTLNETPVPSLGDKGRPRKKLLFDRAKLQELRSATP
jgi:transcriptional regulator with XRE-family HTH domain